MLPPGLAFVAADERALAVARDTPAPRFYWDWARRRSDLNYLKFCGTLPIAHLAGLEAALALIEREGLAAVHARHARLARAVHAAVERLGRRRRAAPLHPRGRSALGLGDGDRGRAGIDPEALRSVARERFQVAVAGGLGPLHGRAFRIGHLGDMNEAMLLGCLAGVQAAMQAAGHRLRPARRRCRDRLARSTDRARRRRSLLTAAASVDPLSAAGLAPTVRACPVVRRSARRVQGEALSSAKDHHELQAPARPRRRRRLLPCRGADHLLRRRSLPRPHLRHQPGGLELQARRLQRPGLVGGGRARPLGSLRRHASSAAAASCCAAAATTRCATWAWRTGSPRCGRSSATGSTQNEPQPVLDTPYEYRRRPNERLSEAPVTSVRAVVGPPEQRCWVERQQVAEPDSASTTCPAR